MPLLYIDKEPGFLSDNICSNVEAEHVFSVYGKFYFLFIVICLLAMKDLLLFLKQYSKTKWLFI